MFLFNKGFSKTPFENYKNIKSWYSKNKRNSRVTLGLRGSSGRNKNGRIIVYSKGSVKAKVVSNIMSNTFVGFKYLNFLAQIRFDVSKSGIVGLFNNSLGCWFNSLLPNGFFIFDYIKLYKKFKFTKKNLNFSNLIFDKWPRVLRDMSTHSRICSIEIVNNINKKSKGIKLVKSAGCRAVLLDNKYKKNFSIIILPSLEVKVIDSSSVAFLNFIENQLHKFLKSKKAGFYKNYGKKPQVRGIVKNPCDHPNGGRARTILLSRTPWGKVAKKSRKVNLLKKFKEISKRLTRSDRGIGKKLIINIFQDNSTIVRFLSKS